MEREGTIEQERREAELVRFCAVAAEARKWEEREARLVRRIDKLTHRPMTSGMGVAGASEGARRQLETTAASLSELVET